MIDLTKIVYRAAVIDENGNQYNIKEFIEDLGWEENENEIAVRSSFTVKDDETAAGYLSEIIKPGCLFAIFAADDESFDEEVARGYVETWTQTESNGGDTLKCVCYDELYKLQKSQDNLYFQSGTGTQAAITGVLDDWSVPQGEYKGPDVTHGKMAYKNTYLSDFILDVLDDAAKKGGDKCFIRASQGYTSILPKGSNEDIYVFELDNTISFTQTISLASLITRVKVMGQADDDGKSSVEATLNGLTDYGIRQRIYLRGSDETIEAATSAAQEILNDEGKIAKEMTVKAPDVPFIRKYDLVYIIGTHVADYYYVDSIQHSADSGTMTMELELFEPEEVTSENTTEETKEYNVGDIVTFNGGTHYVSSYSDAKGYTATAGPAQITKKDGAGGAHPWHLIHTDSTSNVYGWVDDGTFS